MRAVGQYDGWCRCKAQGVRGCGIIICHVSTLCWCCYAVRPHAQQQQWWLFSSLSRICLFLFVFSERLYCSSPASGGAVAQPTLPAHKLTRLVSKASNTDSLHRAASVRTKLEYKQLTRLYFEWQFSRNGKRNTLRLEISRFFAWNTIFPHHISRTYFQHVLGAARPHPKFIGSGSNAVIRFAPLPVALLSEHAGSETALEKCFECQKKHGSHRAPPPAILFSGKDKL